MAPKLERSLRWILNQTETTNDACGCAWNMTLFNVLEYQKAISCLPQTEKLWKTNDNRMKHQTHPLSPTHCRSLASMECQQCVRLILIYRDYPPPREQSVFTFHYQDAMGLGWHNSVTNDRSGSICEKENWLECSPNMWCLYVLYVGVTTTIDPIRFSLHKTIVMLGWKSTRNVYCFIMSLVRKKTFLDDFNLVFRRASIYIPSWTIIHYQRQPSPWPWKRRQLIETAWKRLTRKIS